jgi:hypothetical protein
LPKMKKKSLGEDQKMIKESFGFKLLKNAGLKSVEVMRLVRPVHVQKLLIILMGLLVNNLRLKILIYINKKTCYGKCL